MELEVLERYLQGDTQTELIVVEALRRLGEGYARRLGLQSFDVDVIGVDFAAYMLTEGIPGLRRYPGDKKAYLRRAARWFASNQSRSLRNGRLVALEVPEDLWLQGSTVGAGVLPEALTVPDTQSVVMEKQTFEEMDRLVSRLSGADQQIYHLCMREGRNCVEAANALGWKPAAARKRLERLRLRLRSALHPLYPSLVTDKEETGNSVPR
jgi:DNA-directed RNA polymerase specialized sigma24 family protein